MTEMDVAIRNCSHVAEAIYNTRHVHELERGNCLSWNDLTVRVLRDGHLEDTRMHAQFMAEAAYAIAAMLKTELFVQEP